MDKIICSKCIERIERLEKEIKEIKCMMKSLHQLMLEGESNGC